MAEGLRRLLNPLLRNPAADPYWRTGNWTVQLGERLTVVRDGVPVSLMDCSPRVAAAGQLPVLLQLQQVAYLRQPAGHGAAGGGSAADPLARSCFAQQHQHQQDVPGPHGERIVIRMTGHNLGLPMVTVVVKAESQHLYAGSGRLVQAAEAPQAVEGSPTRPHTQAAGAVNEQMLGAADAVGGAGGVDVLEVVVGLDGLDPGPKLLWVEVGSTMYHSEALPLLLVEEEGVVAVSGRRTHGMIGG